MKRFKREDHKCSANSPQSQNTVDTNCIQGVSDLQI